MNEDQLAIESLSELIQISKELSQLQMMFVITIVVVVVLFLIIFYTIRSNNQQAKSDNSQMNKMLEMMGKFTGSLERMAETNNKRTEAFLKAVNSFRDTQAQFKQLQEIFWIQNQHEHASVASILELILSALRKDDKIDTSDIESLQE